MKIVKKIRNTLFFVKKYFIFCKEILYFYLKIFYYKLLMINDNNCNQFSSLSYELTKLLNTYTIKENGIYFTPADIIKICIDKIKYFEKEYNITINNILEPCCGSGEFIKSIDKHFIDTTIYGIENNNDIYNKIKNIELKNNKLILENTNFFHKTTNNKYDLIIGNPPYYVVKKNTINDKYFKYFDGRPNIFILFIIDCLKSLNKGGILCFVLPNSFMNCLYYDKTRKYIKNNYRILDIIFFKDNKFLNTKQGVFIMIVQNANSNKNSNEYILNINEYTIFNEKNKIKKLKELYENSINLNKLKFSVNVGTIIWNEHKNILSDDENKTLLIYNGYLKNNNLSIKKFNNTTKKNYIDKDGINEVCLVVNRGYGVGDYHFNYSLIDLNQKYLVENHLLVIKYIGNKSTKDEIKDIYNQIIKSFGNDKTKEFISIYFGNNALNINELLHILPIYV